MGALSYFLEREGLATTGISLVRENTASMQPPRSLWVPFPLGRPLGNPGDVEFQRDVVLAALGLLAHSRGPVLVDYPHDVPAVIEEVAQTCPVSFAAQSALDDTWATRLSQEYQQLRPWYLISRRRRDGRTLVGVSDNDLQQNVEALAQYLDEGERPKDIRWLKRAIEDIKAYYLEAMTAQPGDYDHRALQDLFWRETVLAAAILAFYHQFQASSNPQLRLVARMLAPREAVEGATGPKGAQ